MKRGEAIRFFAVENADKRLKEIDKLDFAINAEADYDAGLIQGFQDGVKWADDNPNMFIIKKVLLFALQRTNVLLADDWNDIDWHLLVKRAMACDER